MTLYQHLCAWLDKQKKIATARSEAEGYGVVYAVGEQIARPVKTIAQMAIGAALFCLVCVRLLLVIVVLVFPIHAPTLPLIFQMSLLTMMGKGLAYSAAVELAYMLFTPGPDEALQPVILGLASAVLIILSDDTVNWADAIVAPLLCLSIGFLFYIKRTFIPES